MSMQFSSICPIDRTLPSATTPGQRGPGSDGNEVQQDYFEDSMKHEKICCYPDFYEKQPENNFNYHFETVPKKLVKTHPKKN